MTQSLQEWKKKAREEYAEKVNCGEVYGLVGKEYVDVTEYHYDFIDTLIEQVWNARGEEVMEIAEGMEQENNYSTAYGDWTPERAIEEEAKTQGYNQALTDLIATLTLKISNN